MRFIRRLLVVILLLVLASIGFVLGQYNPEIVEFDVIVFSLPAMPLGLIVSLTLLLGFIGGVVISGIKIVRLRLKIASLRRALDRSTLAERSNSTTAASSKVGV